MLAVHERLEFAALTLAISTADGGIGTFTNGRPIGTEPPALPEIVWLE